MYRQLSSYEHIRFVQFSRRFSRVVGSRSARLTTRRHGAPRCVLKFTSRVLFKRARQTDPNNVKRHVRTGVRLFRCYLTVHTRWGKKKKPIPLYRLIKQKTNWSGFLYDIIGENKKL